MSATEDALFRWREALAFHHFYGFRCLNLQADAMPDMSCRDMPRPIFSLFDTEAEGSRR